MVVDAVAEIAREWRERRPDLDASPLLVVGRIQRLWAVWDTALRAPFAAAGLQAGDFDVLAALRRSGGPTTPGALARATLVTAGATTKRIDRLVAAGLVARWESARDGRQRLVAITPTGIDLADHLIELHLRNEERLLSVLSQGERTHLASLLSRLLDHADRSDR